ncbi:hypothetical protein [Candidatus Aalborgicola defluviihabitans]
MATLLLIGIASLLLLLESKKLRRPLQHR